MILIYDVLSIAQWHIFVISDIISTSRPVAALLHGIGAAKYESGKVTKVRFAGSSFNVMCLYWHPYFYTNICWPNHTHNQKHRRVVPFMVTWSPLANFQPDWYSMWLESVFISCGCGCVYFRGGGGFNLILFHLIALLTNLTVSTNILWV